MYYYSVNIVIPEEGRVEYSAWRYAGNEDTTFHPGVSSMSYGKRGYEYTVEIQAESPERAISMAVGDYQPRWAVIEVGEAIPKSTSGSPDSTVA